jgi:hypothetical protein
LALQCSHVGFWDANYVTSRGWNHKRQRERKNNITLGKPSYDRWISASLDAAWWTDIILEQDRNSNLDITTTTTSSSADVELLQLLQQQQQQQQVEEQESKQEPTRRPDLLLPPPVQLSPGRHKYVLVKVVTRGGGVDNENNNGSTKKQRQRWFVKSASPEECGGPYHANVAQDLVESIRSAAAGYGDQILIEVTGGGRINYSSSSNQAHVYGFSYGFGKGDHARVAALITAETGILATHDNSNDLY